MYILTVSKSAGTLHDDLCATRKGFECNCPSAVFAFPETRVVVGCVDMAQQTQSALELRGYQVVSTQGDSPQRPKEEQRRASQLLARIFGN